MLNSSSQITLEISKYYYATPYSWELETSVLTEGDYAGAYLCNEHGKTHALNSVDTAIYKSGKADTLQQLYMIVFNFVRTKLLSMNN